MSIVNSKFNTIEEAANFWVDVIDNDPYEYDDVSYDKLQELKKERKLINDQLLENKILHIIKYYHLTDRDNPFPYHTYQFILNGKLFSNSSLNKEKEAGIYFPIIGPFSVYFTSISIGSLFFIFIISFTFFKG